MTQRTCSVTFQRQPILLFVRTLHNKLDTSYKALKDTQGYKAYTFRIYLTPTGVFAMTSSLCRVLITLVDAGKLWTGQRIRPSLFSII